MKVYGYATATEVNGYVEITTPFLDRHNDHLQIYVKYSNENNILITDDGYILEELALIGIDFKRSNKRKATLDMILHAHGVGLSPTGELYVKTDISRYASCQRTLIQAMLHVSNLDWAMYEDEDNDGSTYRV